MCYDDASRGSGLYTEHRCAAVPGAVIAKPIDCGGDDYFSPDPAPGSWLASHWNTYNSAFLGSCADPTLKASCSAAATGSSPARAASVPVSAPSGPSASAPLQDPQGAALGTVTLTLDVSDGSALADVASTPVTLPPGTYEITTCLQLVNAGADPWKRCWSRTTGGGEQRPLEEQLTVTRPPSGTARVSGWVQITRAGSTVAVTAALPALDVPSVASP
jgi:hypothetical protein